MNNFQIIGDTVLQGTVKISGAKNAALPIIFATILLDKPITLQNIPQLKDVEISIDILKHLGANVTFVGNELTIDPRTINKTAIPLELSNKMRASIWTLAPLIMKYGNANIFFPGGCVIGARPIDLHLSGLQQLGVEITTEHDNILAKKKNIQSTTIAFPKVSVGATVSLLLAAATTPCTITLQNIAREPEVMDLINFLRYVGVNITVDNTTAVIQGASSLHGETYTIIPDRIEAGSFLIGAAVTHGDVLCTNINATYLEYFLEKMHQAGIEITHDENSIRARYRKPYKGISIETAPYPYFPTDLQAQFSLFNALGDGNSVITENIFENRFMHVKELNKMGANMQISNNATLIHGVNRLHSATVTSTDLRASISLVLAAIAAQGTSLVKDIHHIDRGYENVEEKLLALGAKIKRC